MAAAPIAFNRNRRYSPGLSRPPLGPPEPPLPAQPGEPGEFSDPSQPTSQALPTDPLGGTPQTNDFNLYRDSLGGTPISTLPGKSVGYNSTSDIAEQYKNNRDMQQNEGDRFESQFSGDASRRAGLENAAGLKSGQLYNNLEQTPGYSGQEQDAIMGNNADGSNNYKNLLNTDYGSNYLSPDEQAKMSGDPNAPGRNFNASILDNVNSTANNMQQGAISGAEDRLHQNAGTMESNLRAAVDPNQLNISRGYQDNMSNVLTDTGGKVTDAANNKALGITDQYGRQAGMSDKEVADTAAMGGQAVGAGTRSAIQDLQRQADASGNSSPLAVAAMRSQFEDQNAVNSADATVRAQLAARQAQRDASTGVEKTRLGAQQYQTGAQIQGAEAMGNMAQNALDTQEKLRMTGAQDISNRGMNIASTMGQVGQQNANTLLNAQTGQAQDYAGRGAQAGMYNQNAAYGAAANAEQLQAQRAAAIAGNRQNTNQANQANQFNRGYQVNNTLSGAATGIADARRAGQQETRNYYTGQQQYQGTQGNQANQNLLTNRGQTQQGVNAATQGSANWELGNKNAGNWFTKNVLPVVQAGAGVAAKAVKQG